MTVCFHYFSFVSYVCLLFVCLFVNWLVPFRPGKKIIHMNCIQKTQSYYEGTAVS